MRFFIIILFISYTLQAQISTSISYKYPEIVATVSNIRTSDDHKYIGISNVINQGTTSAKRELEITKLTPCNEILWTKNYSLANANLEQRQILQETGTDNIFLIGFYTPNTTTQKYLYVQKTDANGEVIFAKSYDFGTMLLNNSYTNFATATGIVITAKYAPLGGGASYTTLISIKNNGDLEHAFRHQDTYTGISAAKVSDNTFFIRSFNLIYLCDIDGNIHWASTYTGLLQSSNFFNALYVKDGFVVSVRKNSEYYLVKFNLHGDFVWKTDIKHTGYWPLLYTIDNQNIQIASFLNFNGSSKPILITYDQNGNNIREQVLDNLNIDAYGIPSAFVTSKSTVDMVFQSSSTLQGNLKNIIFNENIHASSCLEDTSLPEVDNLINAFTKNVTSLSSAPIPLNQVLDHPLNVIDTILEDSVRCNPILLPDTVSSEFVLNCVTGYTYEGSDPNATYYWPHDQSTDQIKHFDSAGEYEVIIKNCHSITHERIEIKDYCDCDLFVPNAFTPNQDGHNDSFGAIDNCEVPYYRLEIYDRWGKRLFVSTDINKQWDGTYKQELVKSDVYFYKIEYTPNHGQSIQENAFKQGTVLVLY